METKTVACRKIVVILLGALLACLVQYFGLRFLLVVEIFFLLDMAMNCDLTFDYIKDVLQEQDEDLPISFEVQGVGRKVSKQRLRGLRVVKKMMIILLMILTVYNRGQYF